MVIVAVLLCIVVPAVIAYLGLYYEIIGKSTNEVEKPINAFISNFPDEDMRNKLASLPSLEYKFVYLFLTFMMIPFFLMVTIINSMVTAANSFVGEKERNTLETLLFAPISIKELFIGKVLSSFIPASGITFTAYLLNLILVNSITYSYFKEVVLVTLLG